MQRTHTLCSRRAFLQESAFGFGTLAMTPDLARAITESKGEPLRRTDPTTKRDYVLIQAEVYDRISRVFVEGLNPRRRAHSRGNARG